ncbi:purple acid phosphatase 22-like [Phragmites australis]|uniref:purple acid phosphatase 22-like n=1 Tax=Phragmites australis TaxID=29695 RepID=UPI002D79C1ED|nr:purple acid phosphatase 22-like [Phragmites australis]
MHMLNDRRLGSLPLVHHAMQPKKMTPTRCFLVVVRTLVVSAVLACSGAAAAAAEYVRPPPGRIILTEHTEPASHPQQVHVSVVGVKHMRVSWVTDDKHVQSVVEYGKVSGNYTMSTTGDHTSYRYFLYSSGKIHHVKIGPLDPGTVYYYRCGMDGEEFSLRTPPAALPIELAIAGDLGQTEWTASTLAHVSKSDYDVLLVPGDLSYADTQQTLWDSFGRFAQRHASRRPWMVTQGNHEVEAGPMPLLPCSPRPFAAYGARWRMPYEESGSASNLYYSFDAAGGAVHVVMLGSYAYFNASSDQYMWLARDLAGVDRRATPWLVVLLHAPWYNTNAAHQGEGEAMRKAMERLLYEARVDVVFAGHVHAYERFTRVYNNEANPCGPVYITIGDGGNREGLAFDFEKNHRLAPLSVTREASFGHGRLSVVNATMAHWAWHRNDDADSVVRDELWLESLVSNAACRQHGDPGAIDSRNDEL